MQQKGKGERGLRHGTVKPVLLFLTVAPSLSVKLLLHSSSPPEKRKRTHISKTLPKFFKKKEEEIKDIKKRGKRLWLACSNDTEGLLI